MGYLRKAQTGGRHKGFTLIELLMVVSILMVFAAIAIPNIMQAVYSVRLNTSAGDLSGLMQQARMVASRSNATYAIRYAVQNGQQIAYLDTNANGSYDLGEPLAYMASGIVAAAQAPSGTGGQPTAYTMATDSGSGSWDNTQTMAFSARGLPCNYDTSTTPPTCTTPAARYFVFYLTLTGAGGQRWAGVVVSKAGRTRIVTWDGTSWN